MNMQAFLFFIFFLPTSLNNACRDPSTVEYSECALRRWGFSIKIQVKVEK